MANATLLANFAPVFVSIGAHFFFGEKITPRFVAGMLIAFVGAALVVGASFERSITHLIGDALGVVTAVFYAGYMLSLKKLRANFSTATIMSWSGLFSCAALGLIALASRESFAASTLPGWGALIALALVSHVGGQSLIAFAFAHLSASFSSVGLLLQPVIATLLAWIILSEPLTWLQAAGGVTVLAGITLAGRQR